MDSTRQRTRRKEYSFPTFRPTMKRQRKTYSVTMLSTPRKSRSLFLILLFLIVCFGSIGVVVQQRLLLERLEGEGASRTLRKCTFEGLRESFTATTRTSEGRSCWSLKEEILRVPFRSIVNRNHLSKLGQGYKGGVHKALIKLNDNSYCWAALKTDHCHSLWTYPLLDRTGLSCVADYTFLRNDASYLAGEYTGALAHYVAYRNNQTLTDGLLPTWAVVVQTQHDRPLRSLVPRAWLKGCPHADSTILGVIMPLQDFVPLTKLSISQRQEMRYNTSTFANTMLTAAQGLEFIHSLGLVFQDVLQSNIGITTTSDATRGASYSSMLYDNTYLAQLGQCTRYCDFCWDNDFSQAVYTNHRVVANDPIESDVRGLATVMARLTGSTKLQKELLACRSATVLVKVLHRRSNM